VTQEIIILMWRWRKGGRRVNTAHKKSVHMYVNAKMISVETISGMGAGGYRRMMEGGECKYDIFDTLQEPV
jgi:hypothetical protein